MNFKIYFSLSLILYLTLIQCQVLDLLTTNNKDYYARFTVEPNTGTGQSNFYIYLNVAENTIPVTQLDISALPGVSTPEIIKIGKSTMTGYSLGINVTTNSNPELKQLVYNMLLTTEYDSMPTFLSNENGVLGFANSANENFLDFYARYTKIQEDAWFGLDLSNNRFYMTKTSFTNEILNSLVYFETQEQKWGLKFKSYGIGAAQMVVKDLESQLILGNNKFSVPAIIYNAVFTAALESSCKSNGNFKVCQFSTDEYNNLPDLKFLAKSFPDLDDYTFKITTSQYLEKQGTSNYYIVGLNKNSDETDNTIYLGNKFLNTQIFLFDKAQKRIGINLK